ncbi:MAG: putative membrane protein [Nitriliruptoraceae bacterium]|jgi:uncharacterized membrane protein
MNITAEMANGHRYLGYAVFLVVVVSVIRAVTQGRAGAEFSDGLPKLAGLLLPLQFVYGIIVYIQGAYWEASWPMAIVHPLAMFAGVALAGISTAKARKAPDAATAWGAIARFQGIALVLVLIGIGAASAA